MDDRTFQCGVCLELVFKPIVHACGHLYCFWCVHRAMNDIGVSLCPTCRSPYIHFSRICELLHILLSKVFPEEYKQRAVQTREEEIKIETFAPELEEVSAGAPKVSDLLCLTCKELIYRPVVLNCGHAYCQNCLQATEGLELKCPSCMMPHRKYPLQVCLELDEYLNKIFPVEYNKRKESIKSNQELQNKLSASCSESGAKGEEGDPPDDGRIVHRRVGCDGCGVLPIVGKRYKCDDCEEKIGYDLCEDCYTKQGTGLTGRFNQKHTPDHHMKEVNPLRWVRMLIDHRIFEEQEELEEQIIRTLADAQQHEG